MTPCQLLRSASEQLRQAGIPDPETDSALLLSSLCGRPPLALRLDTDTDLSPAVLEAFALLAERRLAREPLQYILSSRVRRRSCSAAGPWTCLLPMARPCSTSAAAAAVSA